MDLEYKMKQKESDSKSLVSNSCDLMDFAVLGILQARILECSPQLSHCDPAAYYRKQESKRKEEKPKVGQAPHIPEDWPLPHILGKRKMLRKWLLSIISMR